MAKRFYISRMIDNGQGQYMPKAMKLLADGSAANPGNASFVYAVQAFIAPVKTAIGPKNFALCIVDCIDQTAPALDADCLQIPDLTLDSTLGQNATVVRNKLQAWGFDTTGITSSTTVGDALQIVAGQINTGWNRNNFDVDKPVVT